MLSKPLLLLALTSCAHSSWAVVVDFPNGNLIPDGNLSGWSDTRTLSGYNGYISDLNVSINFSGGYNGQLYAYLTHGSGFVVLANRVGRSSSNLPGYADGGFNVKFDDAAEHNVHGYQTVAYTLVDGQLTGDWQPDGRNILPTSVGSLFDITPPTTSLADFNWADPNGDWTLFVADIVAGSQTTVVSWSLDMTVIPEPATTSLAAIGLMMGIVARRLLVRR